MPRQGKPDDVPGERRYELVAPATLPAWEGPAPPLRGPALHLPLAELPWEYFEHFCVAFALELDGLEDARLYGLPGQRQRGIDIVGRTPEGEVVVYQARRRAAVRLGAIRQAVADYVDSGRVFSADRFVLCASALVRDTALLDEFSQVRSEHERDGLGIDVYDQATITQRLRTSAGAALVERFFGPAWREALCGDRSPAEPAADDRALISGYLDELELATRATPAYLASQASFDGLRQPVRLRTSPRTWAAGDTDTSEASRNRGDIIDRVRLRPERGAERERQTSQLVGWEAIASTARHLIVLGDAGTGKSWLLQHDLRRRIHDAQQRLLVGAPLEEITVPLRIALPQLASHVDASGTALVAIVRCALDGLGAPEELQQALGEAVRRGSTIMLCDGLDEVAGGQLECVAATLEECARRGETRILMASRLAGYTGPPFALTERDQVVEVVGFDLEEVRAFVHVAVPDAHRAATTIRTIEDDPVLRGLSRTPLLLSFLCLMSAEGRELSTRRVDIFESVLHLILAKPWRGRPGEDTSVEATFAKLRLLGRLALQAAQHGFFDQVPGAVAAEIVMQAPEYAQLAAGVTGGVINELVRVDGVLQRPGLPTPSTGESELPVAFLHRSLCEYLAARHMAIESASVWQPVLLNKGWAEPQWQEILTMLAGCLAARDAQAGAGQANAYLRELVSTEEDAFHWCLLLAGDALAECPVGWGDPDLRTAIVDRIGALIPGPNPDRVRALRVLARLGAEGVPLIRTAFSSQRTGAGAADALVQAGASGWNLLLEQLRTAPEYAVIQAAGRAQLAEAVPLLDALLATPERRHRDEFNNAAAAAALARMGEAGATVLLRIARDPDHPSRSGAIEALAGVQGRADDVLVATLGDADPNARAAAAKALCRADGGPHLDRLRDLLDDESPQVRQTLAAALRNVPGGDALRLAALADSDEEVAFRVLLGNSGAPRHPLEPTVIVAALRHASPRIRLHACKAVRTESRAGEVAPAVSEALKRLLGDRIREVRIEAAIALHAATGTFAGDALSSHDDDLEFPLDTAAQNARMNTDITLIAQPEVLRNSVSQMLVEELCARLQGYPDRAWDELLDADTPEWGIPLGQAAILRDGSVTARLALARTIDRFPADLSRDMTALALLGDPVEAVRSAALSRFREGVVDMERVCAGLVDAHDFGGAQLWSRIERAVLQAPHDVGVAIAESVSNYALIEGFRLEQLYRELIYLTLERPRGGAVPCGRRRLAALTQLVGVPSSPAPDQAAAAAAVLEGLIRDGHYVVAARQALCDLFTRWPERHAEALREARSLLVLSPDHAGDDLRLVRAWLVAGDLEEAEAGLKRVGERLRFGDLHDHVTHELASILAWQGRDEEASVLLTAWAAERGKTMWPVDERSPAHLRVCLARGAFDEAADMLTGMEREEWRHRGSVRELPALKAATSAGLDDQVGAQASWAQATAAVQDAAALARLTLDSRLFPPQAPSVQPAVAEVRQRVAALWPGATRPGGRQRRRVL